MAAARSVWKALEDSGAAQTPYQNYEFLASWQREVGARQGITPFIVVGFGRDRQPITLLPLGLQHLGSVRRVSFLGGSHANYNMGLWDRSAALTSEADLKLLIDCIGRSPLRPDVLTLYSQPRSWEGFANPLLDLPHADAPNRGALMAIDLPAHDVIERTLGAATRGRLRSKQRKLQKLPGYRYVRATESRDIERLLKRFFELKTVHMAEQGLPNVFAEPGVAAFIAAACQPASDPAIEIHALECNDEVLAVFGTLTRGASASVLFNTYTLSENARHSPGLILILELIEALAERGFRRFDLGTGEAQYKSWFCKQRIELFDSFIPLTALGRLSTVGFGALNAAKREIKATPVLWNAFLATRRKLIRLGTSGGHMAPLLAMLSGLA